MGPNQAVDVMSKICREAEVAIDYDTLFRQLTNSRGKDYSHSPQAEALSQAAVVASKDLQVDAIVVVTQTGAIARAIAKYRPECPIVVAVPNEKVANSLLFHRGLIPVL